MIFKKKDLTLEELKEQAEKLGYRLIKKEKHVSFLPCTCGRNKRTELHDVGEKRIIFRCTKCGLSASGRTEKEARINWNDMIKTLEEINK